ncbi:UV DNA damage repair endonuclease UvsE [Candidatus Amarolinea aalborgensis]|uniref:UV DNA damage repair endonuclease UvsE n=1 Tax=Candidatus Amarolinea aalborgensis TaxID=2249329 RepID=UPI003BF9C629
MIPQRDITPTAALRLGLCCQFVSQPIKFRVTTATAILRLPRPAQLARLAELCRANAEALLAALQFCAGHGIGAFRILSQILPVKTHPEAGYEMSELPDGADIMARFRACGQFARANHLRLSFHPDQYVVLNSPNPITLANSLAELDYQAEVAEWVGADTINLHGGGAYGDKAAALNALRRNIERLPASARARLTLENDDKVYTPSDLLPVCADTGVPLVYDVHHHRCLPDGLSVAEITARAQKTWPAEPLFHISSPLDGWDGPKPQRHHDYIDAGDFPVEWLGWPLTVDVEAKAKELAVARLMADLNREDAPSGR